MAGKHRNYKALGRGTIIIEVNKITSWWRILDAICLRISFDKNCYPIDWQNADVLFFSNSTKSMIILSIECKE